VVAGCWLLYVVSHFCEVKAVLALLHPALPVPVASGNGLCIYLCLKIRGSMSLARSPVKFLVDLGRNARTSTQSRQHVLRKGAIRSLNWPFGANLLATAHAHSLCLCDYCVLVFFCYWESIN